MIGYEYLMVGISDEIILKCGVEQKSKRKMLAGNLLLEVNCYKMCYYFCIKLLSHRESLHWIMLLLIMSPTYLLLLALQIKKTCISLRKPCQLAKGVLAPKLTL